MARQVRLTQEGHDRLKALLEQEYARREEATRVLRDLSSSSTDMDDSSMEDVKREKAGIEGRIDVIEDQLARAVIIEDHQVDQVDLGSVVVLKDTGSNEELEVQLVAPIEAGVLEGEIPRISDESPLGKALMGRRSGDAFQVQIGSKTMDYKIVEIS